MKTAIPAVTKAAGDIGDNVVDSMGKAISAVTDSFKIDPDLNPTITPVLDLSDIKKNAPQIGSMLSDQAINVDSAYITAATVSSGVQANKDAASAAIDDSGALAPAGVTFIQNNNSPKALCHRRRSTVRPKNQLSVAKGALTSNAA